MKRKLVTIVIAAAMLLSSSVGVLAEENISAEKSESIVLTISGYSDAVRIDFPENPDSLFINKLLEKNGNQSTFVSGTITKESFKTILDSLNKNENEKTELLEKFDENLGINKKINDLYKDYENKSESELKEISRQAEEIYGNKHDLFDDEMIEKAIEMKFAEKIILEITPTENNGTDENISYDIKSFDVK